MEKIRNRFLLLFFAFNFSFDMNWLWMRTGREKQNLPGSQDAWVWFYFCHTFSLCGRIFRRTNRRSGFHWIFLMGSPGCACLTEVLVSGQSFSLEACGERGARLPGSCNWSFQLPISAQTSKFTLAKKMHILRYLRGDVIPLRVTEASWFNRMSKELG